MKKIDAHFNQRIVLGRKPRWQEWPSTAMKDNRSNNRLVRNIACIKCTTGNSLPLCNAHLQKIRHVVWYVSIWLTISHYPEARTLAVLEWFPDLHVNTVYHIPLSLHINWVTRWCGINEQVGFALLMDQTTGNAQWLNRNIPFYHENHGGKKYFLTVHWMAVRSNFIQRKPSCLAT